MERLYIQYKGLINLDGLFDYLRKNNFDINDGPSSRLYLIREKGHDIVLGEVVKTSKSSKILAYPESSKLLKALDDFEPPKE